MSNSSIDQIYERLSKDDLDGAVKLAKRAYLNDELEPMILNLVAFELENEGDLEGALRVLGESVAHAPNDAMTYANIGHCLVKLARPTHALEAFKTSLSINPKLPRAHHGAGLALWMRGDFQAGDEAQRRAIELDPNYPDPYGALAISLSQRGDHERAETMAKKALALNPNEIQAQLLVADRFIADEKFQEGADLLNRLGSDPTLAPLQRVVVFRKLGNCLDKLRQFPEAFAAYSTSNANERRVYKDLFEADDIETQPEKLDRLAKYFRDSQPMTTKVLSDSSKNGVREHIFVMSFPRSGTTLLEQVLASHPDIVALEEQPTLSEPMRFFFDNRDGIDKLMNASEDELEYWRSLYWRKVSEHVGDVTGRAFVDKQPSLTVFLPLLKRLFPHSKIVFNIRDPRDVVLSCFRHGFVMNANMYEYTDISKLAKLYCSTMECAKVYFEKLNLDVYMHKHEDFIADFDNKTKALCTFLCVDYNENMRNFVETAHQRTINTPSRDQVRAGLNTSGVGYWRNYADQLLEPIEIVSPWVKAYGYEE